ncbi:hypothetical protein [Pseudoalteromonas maricaloris]|uniref:hypothetical protein n=1 Tax=Pseudoalteromonas maricaloris TaxID=184924 RepID=UPI00029A7F1B|nr:hypothetical protein [Pseudoalteromonas flavipulchra]
MKEFFALIDWAVVGVKLIALVTLILFAKQPAIRLILKRPEKDIRDQVEQSLFLLTAFTLIWHFLGSYMSLAFSKSSFSYEEKLQIYYFFFSFYDVLGLAILAGLHWLKRCRFSKFCRWIYFLTTAMISLQLIRYLDRVYLEAGYLDAFYMPIKTGINLATLALIGAYPVFRLLKLKPNHRWS